MAVYKNLLLNAGGGITSTMQQAEQNPSLATLYIGLGGTGVDCIRNIKKTVYDRLKADAPDSPRKEYRHIRFLAVDSDRMNFNRRYEETAVNNLDDSEVLYIGSYNMAAMCSCAAIRLRPEMQWLNPDISASFLSDTGAGGIRQAGRFMFIDKSIQYFNRIRDELSRAIADLYDPTVVINICTGLSGGTGSGCFLDACYLARKAASELGIRAQIFGFFFLPDVNLSKIEPGHMAYDYVPVNGYAAMQELDYCMNLPGNGGNFTQVYTGNIPVEWNCPPVDMCYLIGATKNGQIISNAYDYAMNVVSEFAVISLSRSTDDIGFSPLSRIANSRQLIHHANQEKVIGAELGYTLLGASAAYIPYKDINTYLASAVFSQFAAEGQRTATEEEAKKFAAHTLCRDASNENIWLSLFKEIKAGIRYNSYDDMDWKEVWESAAVSDGRPRANAEFINFYIKNSAENKDIIAKNAESMLSDTNTESLLNRIRRELNKLVCDMAYGPSFAYSILDRARPTNLDYILHNLLAQNDFNKRQEAAQNRYKECCNTIIYPVGFLKRTKYENFKASFEMLMHHELELAAYDALHAVLSGLQEKLRKIAGSYYCKLNTISETLRETFESNMRTLAAGKAAHNSLVTVSELKPVLDECVNALNIPACHDALMQEFLNNEAMWETMEEFKIVSLINDFFANNVFADFANRTPETFLRAKYQTDNNEELANIIYEKWMRKLTMDAAPLFDFNPVVWNGTMSSPIAYLSVPCNYNALTYAAEKMSVTDNKWQINMTCQNGWISAVSFTCALPLAADNNIPSYAQRYYAVNWVGLHSYESKQYAKMFGEDIKADWSNLPPVTPMSVTQTPPPVLEKQLNEIRTLYRTAVKYGVLKRPDVESFDCRNTVYAPDSDSVRRAEDLIAQANELIENFTHIDFPAADELIQQLHSDDILSLKPVYYMRTDGRLTREDIAESIYMDYFAASPVYQQKVREILDLLDDLKNRAAAAAVELEKAMFNQCGMNDSRE